MAIKRASEDLGLNQEIAQVSNGQEALTYLSDKDNMFPNLIILDINMPIMDGVEFFGKQK